MRTKNTFIAVGAAMAAIALGTVLSVAPANAATSATPAIGTVVTAPMTFGGFNAARAASYGYVIRDAPNGYQYAVPVGTPAGSMKGATPLMKVGSSTGIVPTSSTASAQAVTPDTTVTGDCGTSFVEWLTHKEFETGYTINGFDGPALHHTWNVAVHSSIDFGSYNLNGFPTTPYTWHATRTTDEQALRNSTVTAVAGGTVVTPLFDCYSGAPVASFKSSGQ